MGYVAHHTIVAISFSRQIIEVAYTRAVELRLGPSPIQKTKVNDKFTFFIPPDGSKEGWGESATGDERRDAWVKWTETIKYEDGSSSLDWVEVKFGGDFKDAVVVRHGDSQ